MLAMEAMLPAALTHLPAFVTIDAVFNLSAAGSLLRGNRERGSRWRLSRSSEITCLEFLLRRRGIIDYMYDCNRGTSHGEHRNTMSFSRLSPFRSPVHRSLLVQKDLCTLISRRGPISHHHGHPCGQLWPPQRPSLLNRTPLLPTDSLVLRRHRPECNSG